MVPLHDCCTAPLASAPNPGKMLALNPRREMEMAVPLCMRSGTAEPQVDSRPPHTGAKNMPFGLLLSLRFVRLAVWHTCMIVGRSGIGAVRRARGRALGSWRLNPEPCHRAL